MSEERERTLLLEQIAAGDKTEAAAGPVELTAAERARIQELLADNERILERYPPTEIQREVDRRVQVIERDLRNKRVKAAGTVAAVAIGIAAVVLYAPDDRVASVPPTPVHEPSVFVSRHRDGELQPLAADPVVLGGDRLQVSYTSSGRAYGAILSIDGAGAVTVHLPAPTGAPLAAPLEPATVLPRPFEPGDAPAFLRFFFLTSDTQFGVGPVVDAARRLAALPQAAPSARLEVGDVEQTSLLLARASP